MKRNTLLTVPALALIVGCAGEYTYRWYRYRERPGDLDERYYHRGGGHHDEHEHH